MAGAVEANGPSVEGLFVISVYAFAYESTSPTIPEATSHLTDSYRSSDSLLLKKNSSMITTPASTKASRPRADLLWSIQPPSQRSLFPVAAGLLAALMYNKQPPLRGFLIPCEPFPCPHLLGVSLRPGWRLPYPAAVDGHPASNDLSTSY